MKEFLSGTRVVWFIPLALEARGPRFESEVPDHFSVDLWLNWYSTWLLTRQCESTLQVRVLLGQPFSTMLSRQSPKQSRVMNGLSGLASW